LAAIPGALRAARLNRAGCPGIVTASRNDSKPFKGCGHSGEHPPTPPPRRS